MCIFRNKWKDFKPNQKYLSVVSGLTSVAKLHDYLKQFKPKAESAGKDNWKTPWEFIENKDEPNDCEDLARFAVDVLVRIIGIDKARFIIQSGYDKERWGNKIWNVKCHAICVFEYQGKFGVFSNNELYTGIDSYEDAGRITFKDGLKFQQVRDWTGKILSKKYKIFGVF